MNAALRRRRSLGRVAKALLRANLLPALYLAACAGNEQKQELSSTTAAPPVDHHLFTLLPSSYTGVRFVNRVEDTPELNVFTYRNFYNGGGVAAGDLNGEGLPPVMLTSNLPRRRLYLHQGPFQVQDITEEAGVGGQRELTTGRT